MTEDHHSECEECGASIYKQHLDSGIARHENGKLLCSHCVIEYEKSHDAASSGIIDDFEPIELDGFDDEDHNDLSSTSTRIHSATAATLGTAHGWDDSKYNRPIDPKATTAIRCRSFHSKLTDSALQFMDDQINGWLEDNNHIHIKFATSTIGMFEGKHAEANLIITMFY